MQLFDLCVKTNQSEAVMISCNKTPAFVFSPHKLLLPQILYILYIM